MCVCKIYKRPMMEECLLSGTTLIVDRYVYSTIALSTASGLDLNWCKSSYIQSLKPDLIFYLNMERDFPSPLIKNSPSNNNDNNSDNNGGMETSINTIEDGIGSGNNNNNNNNNHNIKRIQDAFTHLAEPYWKVTINR